MFASIKKPLVQHSRPSMRHCAKNSASWGSHTISASMSLNCTLHVRDESSGWSLLA